MSSSYKATSSAMSACLNQHGLICRLGFAFAVLLFACEASSVQTAALLNSATTADAATDVKEKLCEMNQDGSCVVSDSKPAAVGCGVYMAPSTLGEDSNMGFFAGRLYQENEVVQSEIAIPLLFREWGEHRSGFHDGEIWDRYIWEGSVASLDPYDDLDRDASRAVFVPGIGCTVNSVMDLNNIESTAGSVYDTAGLHRSKDPGSGAFTPYHSSNTTAIKEIQPGTELFASYGDYWIPDIPGAQITLEEEMVKAETFLRNEYYPWILEHNDALTDEMKQALWELTSNDFPIYSRAFTNLPKHVPWKQVEEELELQKNAPPGGFSIIEKFSRQLHVRSIDWLEERGYCQDHIRPDVSTIPQAGRGAFATRPLPRGTVVGYSPLIHMGVHGRELYYVQVGDAAKKSKKSHMMYDLILNYSFGHPNSTLLLTPYGGMVNYINHQPKGKANVAVRWPNRELVAHKPDWLEKTPEVLKDTLEKIGLSFEYVALRDIEEGEEIFMDYGEEWEDAWEQHVKNWTPLQGSENYMHSTELKEGYIRTLAEQVENPYPDNLVTTCLESYTSNDDGSYGWIPLLQTETPHRVYCRVLERSDSNPPMYSVEMDITTDENYIESIVVHDVSSEGVFLYDKAFSADWTMPNTFRHEMRLPDEVMPKSWLNGPPSRPEEQVRSR